MHYVNITFYIRAIFIIYFYLDYYYYFFIIHSTDLKFAILIFISRLYIHTRIAN